MKVSSIKVIHDDGRHNAFTTMVRWRNKYWLVFRKATHHRSVDGRIMIMNSVDLENWSDPVCVIDTHIDDRDPTVYVWDDQLFVASLSLARDWTEGVASFDKLIISYFSQSSDGVDWTEPRPLTPEDHTLWWTCRGEDRVFGSVQVRPSVTTTERRCRAELWESVNGTDWKKVSVISQAHEPNEVAMVPTEQGSLLAFVRHEDKAPYNRPEILISEPPFQKWEPLFAFNFQTNGPCIGRVGDRFVTCSRAFFDNPGTPLVTPEQKPLYRGLILGELDLTNRRWIPQLIIPHSTGHIEPSAGAREAGETVNRPDISYASILDLGDDRFAMSYYEGYKFDRSTIRLAIMQL